MTIKHFKKINNNIFIYSLIWSIAIGILMLSLLQNLGFARAINYSGIVRGATQRLIKKEIAGHPDDELITYLDSIMTNLKTGHGNYNIVRINDHVYQNQLADMETQWLVIKQEIKNVRQGSTSQRLVELSEDYYFAADTMVHYAEVYSNQQLHQIILFFFGYLVISIGSFMIWYRIKQKELHHVLYQDKLTGIRNLTALEMNIASLLEKKLDKQLALICFDVNNFKFLNSSFGYAMGDALLQMIAKAIEKIAIEPHYCARSNADKFYLIIENQDHLIDQIKFHILKEIQSQSQFDIIQGITFCFGGVLIHPETDFREVIDHVDLAHKNAKQMNSHQMIWYDDQLMNQLIQDVSKVKQLYSALKNEDFLLYLQPQIDIHTQKIIGAEALVRWQFSKDIFLYPDDFIPLFEKNGIIHHLDFYMFQKTCQFIKQNHLDETNLRIAINFSRMTLYRKNLSQHLLNMLETYHLSPSCIEIEITENAINGFTDSILTLLQDLKNKGFHISMDDFGTGYSSLSLLNSLPIDTLKIDKDFLLDKHNEKNIYNILEIIINVAHTLDLTVICEGIESSEHLQMLNHLNCDYGQGFLISQPINEKDFMNLYL